MKAGDAIPHIKEQLELCPATTISNAVFFHHKHNSNGSHGKFVSGGFFLSL